MSSFTYQNEYNTGTGLFASGAANSGGVPIGTIIMWATATPPSDYLKCDGTLYATAGSYAQLFAVIGTTYGAGAGQFAVPNFTGKFPAGTGGVASLVSNRQIESGVIGSDGSTATNTNTGVSVLDVVATPDHHHDATISVTLNDHNHAVGTLATTGGGHTHPVGTIDYTQDLHNHDIELHTHNMPHDHAAPVHNHNMPHDHAGSVHNHLISAHHHDLDTQGGGFPASSNYAFPFRYNNLGSGTYKGVWYGFGDDAAAAGATHCWFPQNVLPQDNDGTAITGNPLGFPTTGGSSAATTENSGAATTGASSAATTGNSNTSVTASKAATGGMSGDTATGGAGTAGAITGDTADAPVTSSSATAAVGAYETTTGAAITQEKYAPPFLAITFCIRYRQT